MVYLSKEDTKKVIKELSKTKNKKLIEIRNKLKSFKKVNYVKEEFEIVNLLNKAFEKRRKVKIRYYTPHSDEHTTRVVDIYQIHKGCIVAFCHLRKEERTFVIDRINSAVILDEKYKIPKNWSSESIILDK